MVTATKLPDAVNLHAHLLDIEHRLWTNDAVFYEANLTPDAMLVFAETGVISRDVAIQAIRKENAEGRRWEEARFEDVRLQRLTGDAALLCYRVRARWVNDPTTYAALCSSVYVKHGEAWKLAFHQQTKVD